MTKSGDKEVFHFKGLPMSGCFSKMISEHLPMITFVIDRNEIFQFSEGSALQLIGLAPGEAVGRSLGELFQGLSSLPEIRKALREEKSIVTTEVILDRKFRASFHPYKIDGEYQGLMGFAMDTTKDESLIGPHLGLSPELTRLYAHDIRGSVAGIQSFLVSVKKGEFLDGLTKDQKHIFELMIENCKQTLALTESMAKESKSADHPNEASCQAVLVSEFFFHLYEQAKPIAESKNLRLILSLDKAPALFSFDPSLIRRAVNNLLYNAFEHSKKGLFVEVRVRESIQGELLISIKDEGVGMPKVQFEQMMASEAPPLKNRGLGLFIVRQIVNAHGGKFEMRSEPHQGSRFTLRLPTKLGRF